MPHIVCFDPRNSSVPGTVVEDSQEPRLRSHHVGLLPVDKSRLYQGPANAFAQRFTGKDGWHYTRNQSERGCHLFMALASSGYYQINWIARLEPIDPELVISGKMKLITDVARHQLSGGLNPKDRVDQISGIALDKYGGLTVRGMSEYNTTVEGVLSLCLHGVMNNVRVTSLSVTALTT